jgi:fluoroacetyl-CoA thioesterase
MSSPSETLKPGIEGRATTTVTPALTAPAMGSGMITVYATPAMVALMEEAAVACVEPFLAPGEATLGVHLDVSHKAPSPVGAAISATATLTAVEGRKLSFEIEARDGTSVIGEARHTRVIVDAARFAARLASKAP